MLSGFPAERANGLAKRKRKRVRQHGVFIRRRKAVQRQRRRMAERSPFFLWLIRIAMAIFCVPALVLTVYAFAPPPATPLMVIRLIEGYGLHKDWAPLSEISPSLQRAVIASEDGKFCRHTGFDWQAVGNAIDRYRSGNGHVLGASTISMQTSKNLFFWPGRTFLRKGGEAFATVWLETILSKRRILTLYLNIVEWGPGIYGAEAAAQHWFGVPAARLSPRQAALLAASLPDPLDRDPANPSAYMRSRAGTILARMGGVPAGERLCRGQPPIRPDVTRGGVRLRLPPRF